MLAARSISGRFLKLRSQPQRNFKKHGGKCVNHGFMADSFPLIRTARLMMRPFAMDDVDDLHRLWVDPGVRKFLWDNRVIPRETAVAVVESSIESFVNQGFGFWAICFKN